MTLDDRIDEAHRIVDEAIATHLDGRDLAGVVVLFSGGNDSTVLAHLMRDRATHFAHCNTGIGIEQTRQFVRDISAVWGKPLIEVHPPAGSTYDELVIDQGFPGPGMHYKMFQRLKERGLRQVRKQIVSNGRKQRVAFLAGRRRDESQRRMNIPENEREGSIIWISPLANWTNDEMRQYREQYQVPRNAVSDMIHMSGECLCGAFAAKGELEEVGFFFPEVRERIERLELAVKAAGHAEPKCMWGWGGDYATLAEFKKAQKSGRLCSSCDVKFEEARHVATA